MAELVEKHLERIGLQMGDFLRGFADPAVHLGTAHQFAQEFRRVLDLDLLRDTYLGRKISYAQALESFSTPFFETEATDPVSVLVRGLGGPGATVVGVRRQLQLDALTQDLRMLLRTPVLRFYLGVADRDLFLSAVESIVNRSGFGGERFRALPLVSAVSSLISYEMLREAVCLDVVQTYQEEGFISALPRNGEEPS